MNDTFGGLFSARVNMNLREAKGWSYGVSGNPSFNAFAVPYDSLRALTGIDPITEPVATLHRVADQVAQAGAKALARDPDQMMVVISENDL